MSRWSVPLLKIASILEPGEEKTSQTVEKELRDLLEWLKQTYTLEEDTPMVKNILSYSLGFWKGLFTCYDEYHVPRTNNELEQFFRQTKATHRRITGLRNWNSYILRNGEMIVLVKDALRQEHVLARLRSVSYEAYKTRKVQWEKRLSQGVQRKRFNRDPIAYLQQLEQQCEQQCVR